MDRWEGRNETILFTNDKIAYVENLKELTEALGVNT